MFTQQSKTYTSKRLVYSENKAQYQTHFESGLGYLKQLDEKLSSLNNIQIGEGYSFIIEGDKDIKPTDKIIIDSEEYEVKGVTLEELGSIKIKKLLLTKRTV